jgi:proline dehydrogenase
MGHDRALLLHLATSRRLERCVKGLPGGKAVAWRAASRYVAGRTEPPALQAAEALVAAGHAVSVDLFGERVDDPAT